MGREQFRVTVHGTTGPIVDHIPDNWSEIARYIENRGGTAALERRLITDKSILPMLADTTGYIVIGDIVICPWEVLAKLEG